MMKRALLALAFALLTLTPARAQDAEAQKDTDIIEQAPGGAASDLPAAIADEEISVDSAYRGSQIDVWGVNPDRRGRGDIVVVVRGPNQPAMVMRKRRFLGLWVNSAPVAFSEAPSFFAVLSTRPVNMIAERQIVWSLQIDPAASSQLAGATPDGTSPADYRAALVRLRREQNLYQINPAGIRLYEGGLFRAQVALPANAPIGRYYVDSYHFRNGRLISSQRSRMNIARVGFERTIHDMAMNWSFVYGLMTVALALVAGSIAAFLFRRG